MALETSGNYSIVESRFSQVCYFMHYKMYVEIHQVRILVFDYYQRCPMPLRRRQQSGVVHAGSKNCNLRIISSRNVFQIENVFESLFYKTTLLKGIVFQKCYTLLTTAVLLFLTS